MSGSEEEEPGFLTRWSRRKRAVAAEPEPEAAALPEAVPEPLELKPPAACPIPGGPAIDLASLPKLEDLTIASDLTPFLRAGVPAGLRNAALRRMWSLDPEIRDFINSVEYQWDFNTPGGLPAGFSNELLGDVSKMLAQAIGYDPTAKPKDPDAPEGLEAAPYAPVEAPSPPPLTLAETPNPAFEVACPGSSPLAALTHDPVPPEAGAPRRRHGSALPA